MSAESIRVIIADDDRPFTLLARVYLESTGFDVKERTVVERAKGVVMDTRRLSEADAYRLLRTESQNRRVSIHELAAALVMAEDLLVSRK